MNRKKKKVSILNIILIIRSSSIYGIMLVKEEDKSTAIDIAYLNMHYKCLKYSFKKIYK